VHLCFYIITRARRIVGRDSDHGVSIGSPGGVTDMVEGVEGRDE
jgi:hypothetical protein